MATPLKNAAWLRWIEQSVGQFASRAAGGDDSRPRFRCCLDEQPDHLVPEYCLRDREQPVRVKADLFVNPACWFARDGALPPEVEDALGTFLPFASQQGDLVCIRDPATHALQPFWLDSALSALLGETRPGDLSTVQAEAGRVLAMAGVLVPEGWTKACRENWSSAVARGARAFREQGFVPLRRLIHPFHLSALRRYYRHLIRNGLMAMGDSQCARRYIAHNESVARFFHRQLMPAVASFVQESIKPSYVYVGSYQEGSVLKKHIDREQCEFSVSLCLDYAPEPRVATPWPIQLHTASGITTVFQAIGDGLLYRGREIPHSRGPLPSGHTSTSIFFHYVRQDFAGGLN